MKHLSHMIRKVCAAAFLLTLFATSALHAMEIPDDLIQRGHGEVGEPTVEWWGGVEYYDPILNANVVRVITYGHSTEADARRTAEAMFYSNNPIRGDPFRPFWSSFYLPPPTIGWAYQNGFGGVGNVGRMFGFVWWEGAFEAWLSVLNPHIVTGQHRCPYSTVDYFQEIEQPRPPSPDIPSPDYPDPVPEPDTPEIQYLPIYGYSMTTNQTITYPASIAIGWGNSALGSSSFSAGACAHADERCSFVWSGVEGTQSNPSNYYSHGEGTFNIDPLDGLNGFYIGETNLTYHLEAKRDEAAPGVTFYDNTNSTPYIVELPPPNSTKRKRIYIADESVGGYTFNLPEGRWLGAEDYTTGITVVSGVLAKIELSWLSDGVYEVGVNTNLVPTVIPVPQQE